jgi:hypothetical protein
MKFKIPTNKPISNKSSRKLAATDAATAEAAATVDALTLSPDQQLFPASPILAATLDLLRTTLCALMTHRADLQYDLAVIESGFNAALAGNLGDQLRTQDFAVTLLRATHTIIGGIDIRLILRYLILLREFHGSNRDHIKRIKTQMYMLNNVVGTLSRGPASNRAITVALDGELNNVKLLVQHTHMERDDESNDDEERAGVRALLVTWTEGYMFGFSRERLQLKAPALLELLVSEKRELGTAYVEPSLAFDERNEVDSVYAKSMENLLRSLEWTGPAYYPKGSVSTDEWTYDGWSTAFADSLSYRASSPGR